METKTTKTFILISLYCALAIVTKCSLAQTVRYQQSVRGGLAIAANSLEINPNAFTNVAGGTKCSSYSDLVLPVGSTISKAILYVEVYTASGDNSYLPIKSVNFKVPGAASYTTLTSASAGFIAATNTDPGYDDGYGQFIIDVTNLMPANGFVSSVTAGGSAGTSGRYSVADPVMNSGTTKVGFGWGWSLFVVYSNPYSNYRSITIADAAQTFASGVTATVNVPNIQVPSSGTVKAVAAITGSWGFISFGAGADDWDDYASFGVTGSTLTKLKDPTLNITNDILNSTVGVCANNNVSLDAAAAGSPIAMSGSFLARKPYNTFAPPNTPTIGSGSATWYSCNFDADIMDASGILPASATPINATFKQSIPTTSLEALAAGAYGISIDVVAANISKTISPSSIPTGGTATYTWLIDNSLGGALNLTNIGFTDNLPSNLIIASPSGALVSGGSGATLTAAAGGSLVSLSGLNLSAGQTATVTVNVTNKAGALNSDCSTNPAAFTNSFANITSTTANLANLVTPQCLLVTSSLPIVLQNFSAKEIGKTILLKWSTGVENNNDYFEIERSNDGINYETIGRKKGAGNSSILQNYSFTDYAPQANMNYYRLKQVDFNNKNTYSNAVSVTLPSAKNIRAILPNPMPSGTTKLTVSYETATEQEATISLQNMIGQEIFKKQVRLTEGNNSFSIETENLNMEPGIYFVMFQTLAGLETTRLIIDK